MPFDFQLPDTPPAQAQPATAPSYDDAYVTLWRGAYASLRYQHAGAGRLFPAKAGRAEVWEPLGGGWEASLSDDPSPQWGGKLGATVSKSVAGDAGAERGVSFALVRRW